MLAVIAQIASDHWEALFFGYGPLGGIAWWLARQVEKLLAELRARDQVILQVSEKQTEALQNLSHKLSGMSRALIYNAATYGHEPIRKLAHEELEKMAKSP